jgi:hypothetical protein
MHINVAEDALIEAKYKIMLMQQRLEMVQHHLEGASTKELREQLKSEILESRLELSRVQRLLPTQ